MKRVTRDIDPGSARDLLQRVPRACIAFVSEDGPRAQPVAFAWRDGRHLAGIPTDADRAPSAGQEVTLLIDEGVHFFELRGVSLRGRIEPASAPEGAPDGHVWFEVVPARVAAWDYGTLRAVRSDG